MKFVALARFLAMTAQGLFTGAMLLIAMALVPYWHSLSETTYRENFQGLGPYIGSFMIPLMLAAILLPAVCIAVDKRHRRAWAISCALVLAIVPLYIFVQGPVNELILGNSPLAAQELDGLRAKWCFWHWVRTFLGAVAFAPPLFSSSD